MRNKVIKILILTFLIMLSIQAVEIPTGVTDPESLSTYYIQNFQYIRDKTQDYWQSPQESMNLKGGDCEDFSYLTKDILEQLGYECKVYGVFFKEINRSGHAICVFKDKNGYYKMFDNECLSYIKRLKGIDVIKTKFKNWKQIWKIMPYHGEIDRFENHAVLIEEIKNNKEANIIKEEK